MDVLNNYNLTQGKFIEQFEYDLANYLKCKEVIVCSSGTAALHMLYKSIGINQKKGILFAILAVIGIFIVLTMVPSAVNRAPKGDTSASLNDIKNLIKHLK